MAKLSPVSVKKGGAVHTVKTKSQDLIVIHRE